MTMGVCMCLCVCIQLIIHVVVGTGSGVVVTRYAQDINQWHRDWCGTGSYACCHNW